MSLKVIRGNATQDFRYELLKDIYFGKHNPISDRFFYVVPNHIKFEAEIGVLKEAAKFFDAAKIKPMPEVYSISRLAWSIMDTHDAKKTMSDAGFEMLIRTILTNQMGTNNQNINTLIANTVKIFSRVAKKQGFYQKIAAQIKEIRASHISADALNEVAQIANKKGDKRLADKLFFLSSILQEVEKALSQNYQLSNETLEDFSAYLSNNHKKLAHYHFYFEGFGDFTDQERVIVDNLIKNSNVTIALFGDQENKNNPIFTLQNQLVRELRSSGFQFEEKYLDLSDGRVQKKSDSDKIETAWRALSSNQYKSQRENTTIPVFQTGSAEGEVEKITRIIREYTNPDGAYKNDHIRFRDILVQTRDLSTYQSIIEPIFRKNNISFFLDSENTMVGYPLAELLFTLLDEKFVHFDSNAIIRFLKMRLFRIDELNDEEQLIAMFEMENLLISQRPTLKNWQEGFDYSFGNANELDENIKTNIEKIRIFVVEVINQVANIFVVDKSNKQVVEELFLLFNRYQLKEQLANQTSDIEKRFSVQIWKQFLLIIDEFVELFGELYFDLKSFIDLLQSGFSSAKFSSIPVQLDRVLVTESGATQADNYKLVIMMGSGETTLPLIQKNTSLLSDAERETIQEIQDQQEDQQNLFIKQRLKNTSRQQTINESLLFYQAITRSKQHVIFTFPSIDNAGNFQAPSPFIQRLNKYIEFIDNNEVNDDYEKNKNELSIIQIPDVPQIGSKNEALNIEEYYGSTRATLETISSIREEFNIAAYRVFLVENGDLHDTVLIDNSLSSYSNQTKKLSPINAQKLFGNSLALSVSGLEKFYGNPYDYFLEYGLKLKKREEFELTALSSGTFYHTVLEKVVKQIQEKYNGEIRLVDDQQIEQFVSDISLNELITEEPSLKVLESSEKFVRVQNQYRKEVIRTLKFAKKTAILADSSAKVESVEQTFGNNDNRLKGISLNVFGDKNIHINGKIDRFDIQNKNGDITIYDYKSSGRTFDKQKAFDGLEMQLLTYWQALQNNLSVDQNVKGALFARIAQKNVNFSDIDNQAVKPFDIESENRIDNVKSKGKDGESFSGILIDEEQYLETLKGNFDAPENAAKNYGLKQTKNAYYASDYEKKGNLVNRNQLQEMLERNTELIKKAGEKIFSGEFNIEPFEDNLKYSNYRSIIRFDRMLGDEYKKTEYKKNVKKNNTDK